jgi:hypothetical protein
MRVLKEREMRRIEQWARQAQLAEMLTFFETLPRLFSVPRPVLLGSNNAEEILVHGLTTKHRVMSAVLNLDEPFNPNLHLQRTLYAEKRKKPINTMAPIYRELKAGFQKLCLAEGFGNCRGKIIRAHSLQKATFKAHSRQGHVYEFDPFSFRDRGDPPTLVGINDATTFTGFCEYHDNTLFATIENEAFKAHPKQFFLHNFRAAAQAYYSRAYRAKIFEAPYREFADTLGVTSIRQGRERMILNQFDADEIWIHKFRYGHDIETANWSAVEGYAWAGDQVPGILAADFFAPSKDFHGRIVQHSKTLDRLDWVSLTVTSEENAALVLLCAEKGSPTLRALVTSLREIPMDLRTMAIINMVICKLENLVILPSWWDSLRRQDQLSFVNAFDSRYFPRVLPNVCNWHLTEVTPKLRVLRDSHVLA